MFKTPLFGASSILFLLHQLLQWGLKINIPVADAYLDNLLVMPILLTLWLAEKIWLFKAPHHYQLTLLEVIMATVYVLLVTEWLFPLISSRFTFDAWDIPITIAGSVIYFLTSEKATKRAKG